MSSELQQTTAHPASVQKFTIRKPFDKDSGGDCILRTSDDVDFYVLRGVLKLVSKVFADMFSMPQPHTADHELPIVDVAEDPHTIDTLLRSVYPVRRPIVKTLDMAHKLVEASEKYFITPRILPLQSFLVSSNALQEDPLKAYALAFRLGLEEAAVKASDYTHGADLSSKTVRTSLLHNSGDYSALVALYDLKLRREESLYKIVSLFWLEKIVCNSCRTNEAMMIAHRTALFRAIRKAVDVPGLVATDMHSFFDMAAIVRETCANACSWERRSVSTGGAAPLFAVEINQFPRTILWPAERRAMWPDEDD